MPPRAFNLTDAEHRRIERIDRLVLLGPVSVGELITGLADARAQMTRASSRRWRACSMTTAIASRPLGRSGAPGTRRRSSGSPGSRTTR
jgi:hypothetical protein